MRLLDLNFAVTLDAQQQMKQTELQTEVQMLGTGMRKREEERRKRRSKGQNELTRNRPYFNTKANSGNRLRVQGLLIHYCDELRANKLHRKN